MFTPRAIGFIRSPYTETKQIPKGLNAAHDAEGVLEVLSEFEPGLTDIEGFSHLFVVWMFHRAEGFDLVGTPLLQYYPCQAVGDRRAKASSIAARRRTSSNGLSICSAKPAAFMRRWSALLARPEMAMTGWCVWPSKLRNA